MIAEQKGAQRASSKTIERWSAHLEDLHARITGRGMGRWLLMRRSIEDPTEYAYYLSYGPAETSVHELIRIAGRRWAIEDSFEAAKGEVGLDEYEVRKWDGWHRHVTLCSLAHAYLVVLRSAAGHEEGAGKRGISKEKIFTPS